MWQDGKVPEEDIPESARKKDEDDNEGGGDDELKEKEGHSSKKKAVPKKAAPKKKTKAKKDADEEEEEAEAVATDEEVRSACKCIQAITNAHSGLLFRRSQQRKRRLLPRRCAGLYPVVLNDR